MHIQLKVLTGSSEGKLIPVTQEKFLIGRSDECQLRPKSDSISRRHCALVQKDDRLLLIDLKSRNGTIVNEKKLDPAKAKVLKHGDKITVASWSSKSSFKRLSPARRSRKSRTSKKQPCAPRITPVIAATKKLTSVHGLEEADQIKRDRNEPVTRQLICRFG